MVTAYWLIGREIVLELQGGETRAGYGRQIIENLSKNLTTKYCNGYSVTNLQYFRKFYLAYSDRIVIPHPMGAELICSPAGRESSRGFSPHLSWSHYRTLMRVSNSKVRNFYDDAKRTREWVLKSNMNLALRALFGPNIRAEIIYCLFKYTNLAVKNIANKIGYAYSPVYNEIALLIKNGLIIQEKGHWHLLQLSQKTKKIVTAFL